MLYFVTAYLKIINDILYYQSKIFIKLLKSVLYKNIVKRCGSTESYNPMLLVSAISDYVGRHSA